MSDKLYLAWQDEATRSWHTVARLTRDRVGYEFIFTQGAVHLGDLPERLFNMHLRYRYRFDDLINLFRNRIPSRTRPDFHRMAAWLNVTGSEDEFGLLGKFGLIPGSDALLVYPEPTLQDGWYRLEFFVHGIRHMHPAVLDWVQEVEPGTPLLALLDAQNPVDRCAVAVRSQNEPILVGYVPTFYAADFRRILLDDGCCANLKIQVIRNNRDAPNQLRLLCRIDARVPAGFKALDTPSNKPATELQTA